MIVDLIKIRTDFSGSFHFFNEKFFADVLPEFAAPPGIDHDIEVFGGVAQADEGFEQQVFFFFRRIHNQIMAVSFETAVAMNFKGMNAPTAGINAFSADFKIIIFKVAPFSARGSLLNENKSGAGVIAAEKQIAVEKFLIFYLRFNDKRIGGVSSSSEFNGKRRTDIFGTSDTVCNRFPLIGEISCLIQISSVGPENHRLNFKRDKVFN